MAQNYSNPVLREQSEVSVIGAATTLTAADSGNTYILTTSGTDGAAITMPSLKSGLKFKFIIGALFASTDWTIVISTNVMYGSALVNDIQLPAVTENTISFAYGVDTIGDWVALICDGTSWFVSGDGQQSGGIVFTAP